MFQGTEE